MGISKNKKPKSSLGLSPKLCLTLNSGSRSKFCSVFDSKLYLELRSELSSELGSELHSELSL